MTVNQWRYGPGDGYGRMLASTADRERALDVLRAGFAEGRLSKDEHEIRAGQAHEARTYADLAAVTSDLPGGHSLAPAWPPPTATWPPASAAPAERGTNGLAVASLCCGIAQFATLGLTGIPAVILGRLALRDIRRTGQEGTGLAAAGLALGCVGTAVIIFVLAVLVGIDLVGLANSSHAAPGP